MSHPDLLKATNLTREGRLVEATALLQQMLGAQTPSGAKTKDDRIDDDPSPHREPAVIDGLWERVDETGPSTSPPTRSSDMTPRSGRSPMSLERLPRSQPPAGLRDMLGQFGPSVGLRGLMNPSIPTANLVPAGGRFITGSYSNAAGAAPTSSTCPADMA